MIKSLIIILLYSLSKSIEVQYENNQQITERIVILGTNDVHGKLFPDIKTYKNETYEVGGATLMSAYISVLRNEWHEKMLWLDAGDQWTGTLESKLFNGKPLTVFYNDLGLNATAIGNHDFDMGVDILKTRMRQSYYETLQSNIYNKSSQELEEFPKTLPSKIFQVGLVKVGVIGLSTILTPITTSTDVSQYDFKNYTDIVIEQSKELRKNGSDIVILTSHVGMFCGNGDQVAWMKNKIRFKDDTDNNQLNCQKSDELYVLLNSLPSGTLDAVVGGHYHTIVHHWVNNIPVIIGDWSANYINLLYFTVNLQTKKIVLDETYIEGPIPICSKIFDVERRCDIPNPSGNLIDVEFHSKQIIKDPILMQEIQFYNQQTMQYYQQIIGYVDQDMLKNPQERNVIGNFFSDVILKETKADFTVVNAGGIRIDWLKGNLTFAQLFQMMPFDNKLMSIEMTGAEIIKAMTILQEGDCALYPSSNFNQVIQLNPVKKLISIEQYNGVQIDLNKTYVLGSIDFFLNGGDDWSKVNKWYQPRNPKIYGLVRDAVNNQVKQQKVLNSQSNPVMDPSNPRIIIQKQSNLRLIQ